MNSIWHFLKEFESKDLVKRYYKNRYGRNINTTKSIEITSAFSQGREYFSNADNADISVRPLLQYYGVVALSRGLILLLDENSRENNITPSHGLKIINWNEVNRNGGLENIRLRASKGTFTELIKVTKNKSYYRANSSIVNWGLNYDIPELDCEIFLKEVLMCFPDLEFSVKAWLNQELLSKQMNSLITIDDKIEIRINGKNDNVIKSLFSHEIYSNLEIKEINHESVVSFSLGVFPNFSQRWHSGFATIGDAFITPLLSNNLYLNEISKMFCVSFIFGTISRYYPSAWNNIHKGISNDSMLPFALNFMDFVKVKYPQTILDFIQSPHKYELR